MASVRSFFFSLLLVHMAMRLECPFLQTYFNFLESTYIQVAFRIVCDFPTKSSTRRPARGKLEGCNSHTAQQQTE
jgi:hypothetical protein